MPPHGQLRAFFQQGPKRRFVEHPDGNTEVAGATQSQPDPPDDTPTAPDAEPVHRLAQQGDQALGDQAGGSVVPGIHTEQPDRREGQLGLLGLGSQCAEPGKEHQEADQHDPDAANVPGAGGGVPQPGSGGLLSISSEQCERHGLSLASSTDSPSRSGVGTPGDLVPEQRMDADGDDAEAPHAASEWPSKCDPTVLGPETTEGQREGQAEAESSDAGTLMPTLSVLMHVLSHLSLRNDMNWCYANSTIFCLLWTLMTMQCEFSDLGEGFAEMIQFLPCHNLQLVALSDLTWFTRILQNWGSFGGMQQAQQQDSSEFTAATLDWLQAPAINMTWERRFEERGESHVHDRGNKNLPITVSFPASHAHIPETQFTLTALVTRWMQVDGMVASLLQAPECVCLHVDRYFHDEAGNVQKSQCLLDMEAGCDLPIFTGPGVSREYVSYVLVAATAHLGMDQQGHYQALLKTRPTVLHNGSPMHWLLANDGRPAQPTWLAPDWFRSSANVFWLLRADCVHLHTYRPLMQEETQPMMDTVPADASTLVPDSPMCDSSEKASGTDAIGDEPAEQARQIADETEAAILALLQAANVERR